MNDQVGGIIKTSNEIIKPQVTLSPNFKVLGKLELDALPSPLGT